MPGISNGVLYCDNVDFTGAANPTAQLTLDGQLIIGDGVGNPQIATLTAGTGIGIVNGAGTILINSTGGGLTWTRVAGITQAMAEHQGYIPTNVALTTFTLPATGAVGDVMEVIGEGAGGWIIEQNALQNIRFGNATSTVGILGSAASSNQYNTVQLTCTVVDTTWSVSKSVGVLNIT